MQPLPKATIRILLAALSITVLTGCATTSTGVGSSGRGSSVRSQRDLPACTTFWKLRRERYVRGRNDCSNKAGRYARTLIEELGYEATVVVVKTARGTHAVTKVETDGGVLYADPTNGKWGGDLGAWGTKVWEVTRHDLYANREYL